MELEAWLRVCLDELVHEVDSVLVLAADEARSRDLVAAACFIEGDAAPPFLTGSPLTVRVHDEAPRGTPVPGEWWVIRGENEKLHLLQALHHLSTLEQLRELDWVAQDPLPHDFRGAVGILQLANQVLRASQAPASVTSKLESASVKLSALLEDLSLLAKPRSGRGSFVLTAPETGSGPPSNPEWPEQLAEVERWFEAAHRGRELLTQVNASFPGTHSESAAVIRGLVDTAARLSPSSAPILVGTDGDEKRAHVAVTVSLASEAPLSTRHLHNLSDGPLRGMVHRLPFRLRVSLACAARAGDAVDVRLVGDKLQLVYFSEAPPSSRASLLPPF